MAQSKPIPVEIVSDVVCPWCVIGYRQLATAAERLGRALDIRWRPFELNPDMEPEGENLRDHIVGKYGTKPEESGPARAKLTALGAELGFRFDYFDEMRMWNTFAAHQLLHWADRQGRGHDLKQALFAAYFSDRRNVSDPAVLAEAAGAIGLDRAEAAAVLADGRFADAVRQEQRFWLNQGVQGVPAMIFDRRFLAVGARGVDGYAELLKRLDQEAA